jgi:hypothetical protein
MRLGISNALIDQPTIHLLVSAEPQPWREEALAHQSHLVLHLPLLPARPRGAGGQLDQVMAAIWSVFEAERPSLVRYAGRFDGFHAVPAAVSKTCLVRFDNNKYSVIAKALGRPVEVHAYADRIVIRQDGEIVAERRRLSYRAQSAVGS